LCHQLNCEPTWWTCICVAELKAIAFQNQIIIVARSLMILCSTNHVLEILEGDLWTCLLLNAAPQSSASSSLYVSSEVSATRLRRLE
jgi:hypothetical protein